MNVFEGATATTILGLFKVREKEIKAECEKLDREMDGKRKEQERIQVDVLAKLTKKRAALKRMTAEYHVLDDDLTAAAMEADAEGAAMGERVKGGQATFAEVLSAKERGKLAADATTAKLADAAKIIRELATEIIQLERDEAQARVELRYAMTYPGQTQIKKLKAEIEVLERGIGCVLEGYALADVDRERAANDLQLTAGRFIYGRVWENLSYEELRGVRLDPRIHERFLPDLEKIIAAARPEARYHVTLRSGLQNPGGGAKLTYREEIPEGVTLTTTTAGEWKGGDRK